MGEELCSAQRRAVGQDLVVGGKVGEEMCTDQRRENGHDLAASRVG